MISKTSKITRLLALIISFYGLQNFAMQPVSNPRGSLGASASSTLRSQSPTQYQIYLPSRKMEPHRSISQQDLKSLQESIADQDDGEFRLHLRNSEGHTPLELAIQTKYVPGILALMKKGASPAITHEETWQNGFHSGAAYANPEIVKILMIHTVFPDVQEKLEKARKKVSATAKEEQDSLLQKKSQQLKELHVRHLHTLITQQDKKGQTPESLAQSNKELTQELVSSKNLDATYGNDIIKRYMTELVSSGT